MTKLELKLTLKGVSGIGIICDRHVTKLTTWEWDCVGLTVWEKWFVPTLKPLKVKIQEKINKSECLHRKSDRLAVLLLRSEFTLRSSSPSRPHFQIPPLSCFRVSLKQVADICHAGGRGELSLIAPPGAESLSRRLVLLQLQQVPRAPPPDSSMRR